MTTLKSMGIGRQLKSMAWTKVTFAGGGKRRRYINSLNDGELDQLEEHSGPS